MTGYLLLPQRRGKAAHPHYKGKAGQMGRPRKTGIDYFPFDVDFFSDKKIKILKSRFGVDGITIYLYLLCEIYRNGYYIELDDDYMYIISDDLGMTGEKVKQVMEYLFGRSLLIKSTLPESVTIITSHGIQCRFQEAVKVRAAKSGVEVDKRIWLLSEQETLPFIKYTQNSGFSENNESFSEKNPSKSEIYAIKESKVKKSKEKNNIYCTEPEKPTSAPPVITLPLNDNTDYGITQDDVDHWKELYPAVDVMTELRKMKGWCEGNPAKRKTRRGIVRFVNAWLAKEQDRGGSRKTSQSPVSRFLEGAET